MQSLPIALGDALSQLIGQGIHVKYKGKWVRWSQSPNESTSGAAARWSRMGAFTRPKRWIDKVASLFEEDHCEKAFSADYYRALEYIKTVDELGGPSHEPN